jgi:hypothetical protein
MASTDQEDSLDKQDSVLAKDFTSSGSNFFNGHEAALASTIQFGFGVAVAASKPFSGTIATSSHATDGNNSTVSTTVAASFEISANATKKRPVDLVSPTKNSRQRDSEYQVGDLVKYKKDPDSSKYEVVKVHNKMLTIKPLGVDGDDDSEVKAMKSSVSKFP